jgi:hypothetical protein
MTRKANPWPKAHEDMILPFLRCDMPSADRERIGKIIGHGRTAMQAKLTELRRKAGIVLRQPRTPRHISERVSTEPTIQRRCVNTDCRAEFETTSPFIRRCPACSQSRAG